MSHNRRMCSGPCPIHAPSEHHMADWPIDIRASGLVERMCPHGTGHPDPDSIAFLRRNLMPATFERRMLDEHGCDGCCAPPQREPVPDAFQRAWD